MVRLLTTVPLQTNGEESHIQDVEAEFAQAIGNKSVFFVIPPLPRRPNDTYCDFSSFLIDLIQHIFQALPKYINLVEDKKTAYLDSESLGIFVPILMPQVAEDVQPLEIVSPCAIDIFRLLSRHNFSIWEAGRLTWSNDQAQPIQIDIGTLLRDGLDLHDHINFESILNYMHNVMQHASIGVPGEIVKLKIYIDAKFDELPDWLMERVIVVKEEDARLIFKRNDSSSRFSFIQNILPSGDPKAVRPGTEESHTVLLHGDDLIFAVSLLCLAINEGVVVG